MATVRIMVAGLALVAWGMVAGGLRRLRQIDPGRGLDPTVRAAPAAKGADEG